MTTMVLAGIYIVFQKLSQILNKNKKIKSFKFIKTKFPKKKLN